MPEACRNITDPPNDLVQQAGQLLTGSATVDITGAQFASGAGGWTLTAQTALPTQQNPVGKVTVGLYVDSDGRSENNAPVGPRLGADTVFAAVFENKAWRVTKETFTQNVGWKVADTKATFVVNDHGYTMTVPTVELAANAKAYWRVGVSVADAATKSSSLDYAPDVGLSCTPTLGTAESAIVDVPVAGPPVLSGETMAKIVAGALVLIALGVLIWSKLKRTPQP
jgi:hypothetical protein